MTVIHSPSQLRAAAGTLFLCVPIILLEIIVATRSPAWKLPVKLMIEWGSSFLLLCAAFAYGFLKGHKITLPAFIVFGALWGTLSLWQAFHTRHALLGFFTLFLIAFISIEIIWIKSEISKSYFNPLLRWFESLPKPLRELHCTVSPPQSDKHQESRVSRIDSDGLFLVNKTPLFTSDQLKSGAPIELRVRFQGKSIQCKGIPITSISDRRGIGIQFLRTSADLGKELEDFIENLRGKGYA